MKSRLARRIRQLIGTDPSAFAALSTRVAKIELSIADMQATLRQVDHVALQSHHLLSQVNVGLSSLNELLSSVNHRSTILEEIGPRIIGLDELRHKLVYAEAIASDHARNARLDAESVAVLLQAIERGIGTSGRQT
jgi:uncharacterized protein (DUF2461 family)